MRRGSYSRGEGGRGYQIQRFGDSRGVLSSKYTLGGGGFLGDYRGFAILGCVYKSKRGGRSIAF